MVKWLIETSQIPEDVNPMLSALEQQNIEFKELGKGELRNTDVYQIYPSTDCVVFFGTLETAKVIQNKWVPGAFYNMEAYNCTHYYPALGDLLLNCDYIMLPWGELKRQKEFLYETMGEARTIFVRPNRGDKIFTGTTIYKEEFDHRINYLGYGQVSPHELMVVARPINLKKEWRFVCVEGEVITGSLYKDGDIVGSEAFFPPEAFNLAQKVAGLYNPDDAWVIDICQTKGDRFAVVEVGCFSCAGLYKCDRNIIVKRISELALKKWKHE